MKLALRRLGREPWFTAISVLVLALGIGSVTAVFSIVNGILLRPLPYPDPARLYVAQERAQRVIAQYPAIPVNARHFNEWRTRCSSCEQLALLQPASMNLTGDGEPERLGAARATWEIFPLLGFRARLGRVFGESDDKPDAPNVAVIAHSLWQRRFGGGAAVVGRKIRLNGVGYEIVGVLSPEFRFPRGKEVSALIGFPERTEVVLPAAIDFAKAQPMGQFNYAAIARLRPGATPQRARDEMTAAIAEHGSHAGLELDVLVAPFQEMVIGTSARGLWMLLATVGAVLLIVCVNLGNLMLTRAHGRLRESAIRRALGARGRQIYGPILTESGLLAAAGGALGAAVAWAGLRALVAAAPIDLPRLDEARVDGVSLAFTMAASATCALLFGLFPAFRLTRSNPQDALKAISSTVTEGRQRLRARNLLVSVETALSAALLILAGLLGASFSRLMRAERGFEARNVLTADLALPRERYPDSATRSQFHQALAARLAQIAGTQSAGLVNVLPLRGESYVDMIRKQGSTAPVWELPITNYRFVNPGYFAAMGVPLRSGRLFAESDRGRKVAVVSELAAQRVWPGENAVGKRYGPTGKLNPSPSDLIEVVGVVADVRAAGLDKSPAPAAYVPYWQDAASSVSVALRTSADPRGMGGALRAAIREIDAELPVARMMTMDQILAESVGQRRFQTTLAGAFSLTALVLACLGIYGVVSYTAARRTPELGIRIAFGARPAGLAMLVVRQEMAPVAVGLAAGVALALGAARWFGGMLYGVSARDPVIIGGAGAVLLAAAAVACWAPARRAASISVTRALRYE